MKMDQWSMFTGKLFGCTFKFTFEVVYCTKFEFQRKNRIPRISMLAGFKVTKVGWWPYLSRFKGWFMFFLRTLGIFMMSDMFCPLCQLNLWFKYLITNLHKGNERSKDINDTCFGFKWDDHELCAHPLTSWDRRGLVDLESSCKPCASVRCKAVLIFLCNFHFCFARVRLLVA